MKVVVLGDTGMLGCMVKGELRSEGFKVIGLSRRDGFEIKHNKNTYFLLEKYIPDSTDYIINCIGAIKPVFKNPNRVTDAIFTNAVFPMQLAEWAKIQGGHEKLKRVIQITTDCVFSGKDGWYVESHPHDALDEYGKSKSIGEPENCMVLRTSIIGPEWGGNNRSLVEWFLSNEGKEVNGFTNHMWDGLTTLELAKSIGKIITDDLYKENKFHLFSNDVSKYELLELMREEWCLDIKINPVKADTYCNRTLRTTKKLNGMLHQPNMRQMIKDLTKFIDMDRGEYV